MNKRRQVSDNSKDEVIIILEVDEDHCLDGRLSKPRGALDEIYISLFILVKFISLKTCSRLRRSLFFTYNSRNSISAYMLIMHNRSHVM